MHCYSSTWILQAFRVIRWHWSQHSCSEYRHALLQKSNYWRIEATNSSSCLYYYIADTKWQYTHCALYAWTKTTPDCWFYSSCTVSCPGFNWLLRVGLLCFVACIIAGPCGHARQSTIMCYWFWRKSVRLPLKSDSKQTYSNLESRIRSSLHIRELVTMAISWRHLIVSSSAIATLMMTWWNFVLLGHVR